MLQCLYSWHFGSFYIFLFPFCNTIIYIYVKFSKRGQPCWTTLLYFIGCVNMVSSFIFISLFSCFFPYICLYIFCLKLIYHKTQVSEWNFQRDHRMFGHHGRKECNMLLEFKIFGYMNIICDISWLICLCTEWWGCPCNNMKAVFCWNKTQFETLGQTVLNTDNPCKLLGFN